MDQRYFERRSQGSEWSGPGVRKWFVFKTVGWNASVYTCTRGLFDSCMERLFLDARVGAIWKLASYGQMCAPTDVQVSFPKTHGKLTKAAQVPEAAWHRRFSSLSRSEVCRDFEFGLEGSSICDEEPTSHNWHRHGECALCSAAQQHRDPTASKIF